MTRGGGKAPPKMTKAGEGKTARPTKPKVLSKPNEQGKRLMEHTGKRGGKF